VFAPTPGAISIIGESFVEDLMLFGTRLAKMFCNKPHADDIPQTFVGISEMAFKVSRFAVKPVAGLAEKFVEEAALLVV
jgi:hypothetical protein